MTEISPEYLKECLSYDPKSGTILWKARPREHFATKGSHAAYMTSKAGRRAGCLDQSTGYSVIGLNAKLLYAHRVAWALMYGEWPGEQIDHINGDKLDNRATNLRVVTHAENNRNTSLRKSNKSGTMGVAFAKREGKWRARIMRDGRDIHLGYFDTWADAVDARARADQEHGFHPNHGRAA